MGKMNNRIVIDSNRKFCYDGERYYVNGGKGKYVLCKEVDGIYRLLEDKILMQTKSFPTIKAAKRHFTFNHDCLDVWDY